MILVTPSLAAQDTEWLRRVEAAQIGRPDPIHSVARIAPAEEPGVPLVIRGRVFRSDGVTPAAGIIIFAYHTDRGGEYDRRESDSWRLRGWAMSDREGRFEFRTIRPGSYPGGRTPAHVHFTVEGKGLPRQSAELEFLDDPFVGEDAKRRSAAKGMFGGIRPVTTRAGVQYVSLNLRIQPAS